MAIENIQYVYDYIRLYRRAFRPVIAEFFMQLQKEQQIETKKIQLKLARKRCRSRKAPFGHTKYVQLSLLRRPKMCYRSSHYSE